MEKTEHMPLWVFLAFASINTRKTALGLIAASVLFTLYCIPWTKYFSDSGWVATIFRISDWSWVLMMIPITLWYLASLWWVDRHSAWATGDPL